MSVFSELAPFKLNLFLHIVGRRADGYHRLESAFVFADVGDILTYEPGPAPLRLTISGPFAPALEGCGDNLVLRAAHLLHPKPSGTLTLTKNTPVAAGLGGGSADAAAALRLLNRCWDQQHTPTELQRLAERLGADVPPCVSSQPVYVSGIGEEVYPAPETEEIGMLVINPRKPLPTPHVFQKFREQNHVFSQPLAGWPTPTTAWKDCHNDLDGAARALMPDLEDCLTQLASLPGAEVARMSGSGASCFASFKTRDAAQVGANILKTHRPDWWQIVTSVHIPCARLASS